MKKILLIACSLMLCTTFALAGCGSKSWLSGIASETTANVTIAAATEQSLPEGTSFYIDADVFSNCGLATIKQKVGDTTKYGVWSVSEARIIVSCEKNDASEITFEETDLLDYAIYQCYKSDGTFDYYEVVDQKGTIVLQSSAVPVLSCSAIKGDFQYEYWTFTNKETKAPETYSFKVDSELNRETTKYNNSINTAGSVINLVVPAYTYFGNAAIDYFVQIKDSDSFTFYSWDLKKLGTFDVPKTFSGAFLVNDTLIYQTLSLANPNEYDMVAASHGYINLTTYEMNIKSGKSKKISFNYVISGDTSSSFTNIPGTGYKAANADAAELGSIFATTATLVNKECQSISFSDTKEMIITKDGTVVENDLIDEIITYGVTKLNKNRFVCRGTIFDKNFEIIAKYTSINIMNNSTIVVCNSTSTLYAIANANGELVTEFKYNGYNGFANGFGLFCKTSTETESEIAYNYFRYFKVAPDGTEVLIGYKKEKASDTTSTYFFNGTEVLYFGTEQNTYFVQVQNTGDTTTYTSSVYAPDGTAIVSYTFNDQTKDFVYELVFVNSKDTIVFFENTTTDPVGSYKFAPITLN